MTGLFIKILEMSATGSVVIGVIMLLRLALKKAPRIFSYALWTAALFRLLCPISFELPSAPVPSIEIPYSSELSSGNAEGLFITSPASESTAPSDAPAMQAENSGQVPDIKEYEHTTAAEAPAKERIDLITIASYIWAFAAIVMISRGVVSWVGLSRSLKSAQKAGENVYVSAAISDPFIMGIIRPKIYLPTGLSCTESGLIIGHERAHMHRGDHIAKLVMYAALCIHWFNPLVWVMFRLFERDMEMSCDEKVTADMSKEQKADYSQALLKISSKPAAVFTANFGESSTKQRVKNVLSFKKPGVWVIILLTVLAVTVSVVLCANRSKNILTDGKYYADNENINAYFTVKNDSLQLFGTDRDFAGLYSSLVSDWTESDSAWEEKTRSEWEKPLSARSIQNDDLRFTNEDVIEYCNVRFILAKGQKATVKDTDAFSAEAYIIPFRYRYKIDISIKNTTDDELTVNLSEYFGLSSASDPLNPVATGPIDEYTFAPKETKDFVFGAEISPAGIFEDTAELSGSCVLEITNSDKYEHYQQLKLEPYTIREFTRYVAAMGKNGTIGYMEYYQTPEMQEGYEKYRTEVTDKDELDGLYDRFYDRYGENVYSCKFYKAGVEVPLYDESGNLVDHFQMGDVEVVPPEDYEFSDWKESIKLIPLTEERQQALDMSTLSPEMLYADKRNCLFTDGAGGLYLYNFENRELLLAVDFLASTELANSDISDEAKQYGGALIYSSATGGKDKNIYFAFETKGKEQRGGEFNGQYYYLDIINSGLQLIGASNKTAEPAVTKQTEPEAQPDAISSLLAMMNGRDYVYIVNSGLDDGHLPMIRLARNINGNVDYFDPFENGLIPKENAAPEEWGLSFAAENAAADGVRIKLSRSGSEELVTGSYFIIQKKDIYGWSEPAHCIDYYLSGYDVAWTDEALIIPDDGEREIYEGWSNIYGQLDHGSYRIGKYFRKNNGSDILIFAYFNI